MKKVLMLHTEEGKVKKGEGEYINVFGKGKSYSVPGQITEKLANQFIKEKKAKEVKNNEE
jgi:hypothetical protein